MTSEGVPIRRCPECAEEFLPHVVHCSDCGALLEAAFEGDAAKDQGEAPEPAPDTTAYVRLVDGVSPETARVAAGLLSAAGVRFRVETHRYALRVSVNAEEKDAAVRILAREGVLPEQPDASEPVVAAEGGPCPACGDHVTPGTAECPGCGLALAGGVACPFCGAEVAASGQCSECGKEPD